MTALVWSLAVLAPFVWPAIWAARRVQSVLDQANFYRSGVSNPTLPPMASARALELLRDVDTDARARQEIRKLQQ